MSLISSGVTGSRKILFKFEFVRYSLKFFEVGFIFSTSFCATDVKYSLNELATVLPLHVNFPFSSKLSFGFLSFVSVLISSFIPPQSLLMFSETFQNMKHNSFFAFSYKMINKVPITFIFFVKV